MKIATALVAVLFWVGLAVVVVGVIMGLISNVSYLGFTSSPQNLALMVGQVASPIWEGLALIAGSVSIGRTNASFAEAAQALAIIIPDPGVRQRPLFEKPAVVKPRLNPCGLFSLKPNGTPMLPRAMMLR